MSDASGVKASQAKPSRHQHVDSLQLAPVTMMMMPVKPLPDGAVGQSGPVGSGQTGDSEASN